MSCSAKRSERRAAAQRTHNAITGGNRLYLLDRDGRTLFYYAHLDRYAAGLVEGQVVSHGEIIAYVGDTGNAGTGNDHLHFSVSYLADARRWSEGVSTNPYPLLTNGRHVRYTAEGF